MTIAEDLLPLFCVNNFSCGFNILNATMEYDCHVVNLNSSDSKKKVVAIPISHKLLGVRVCYPVYLKTY